MDGNRSRLSSPPQALTNVCDGIFLDLDWKFIKEKVAVYPGTLNEGNILSIHRALYVFKLMKMKNEKKK